MQIGKGFALRMTKLKLIFLTLLGLLLASCSSQEITVGADAPDFSLHSATGETVSLSDFAGRPVLLYFHMAVG